MVNINIIAKLLLSLNKGSLCGEEAVLMASKQFKEIETVISDSSYPVDINLLYEMVFAMNESHANTFESNVYWAKEQLDFLCKLELENL